METRVSSSTKEVVISFKGATVLIGDRINPTGRKKLTAALQSGNMELVRQDAQAQVNAGADILDVNAGASGVDEEKVLPALVRAVMDAVDVPLSLDSKNLAALEAALAVYKGKAIVNSISGEERSFAEVLPLVKKYKAAVIGLTCDEKGIPPTAEQRLEIARKIVERAMAAGIPKEDVIIDCLTMTVATDTKAALVTLDAIRLVREKLGVNQTLGASNISHGLPDRDVLNSTFLALAIEAGVSCPYVHVEKVRPYILATDLLLGRDRYALRYIRAFRQRQTISQNSNLKS
ncbi:MAG: dihydropteroate synthase [Dehalococcoidia bacterium]|nr:dihydropteroate synthase [Dehalococcoidia bacterium]